ncbi:MAG: diaminopimelate epimerase [Bacteroidales bacterium]|nr:diaminopimelate epimerase [Bacteroidales bacterium]
MKIKFQKYQANGNDFIMLVEKETGIALAEKQITKLCDRHFGIGADGLMVLRNSEAYDFEMHYYNSDGKKASMCGNGGRSIASLAYSLGYAGKRMVFLASDGVHEAIIEKEIIKGILFDVSLKMVDVEKVKQLPDHFFLNTGVPHYVEFVEGLADMDVVNKGRQIRFDNRFGAEGTNANFIEVHHDRIEIRTYERGVEDETLSCGTGVTASAIATFIKTGKKGLPIHARGGSFKVNFEQQEAGFVNVWLRGPAEKVFEGEIDL